MIEHLRSVFEYSERQIFFFFGIRNTFGMYSVFYESVPALPVCLVPFTRPPSGAGRRYFHPVPSVIVTDSETGVLLATHLRNGTSSPTRRTTFRSCPRIRYEFGSLYTYTSCRSPRRGDKVCDLSPNLEWIRYDYKRSLSIARNRSHFVGGTRSRTFFT